MEEGAWSDLSLGVEEEGGCRGPIPDTRLWGAGQMSGGPALPKFLGGGGTGEQEGCNDSCRGPSPTPFGEAPVMGEGELRAPKRLRVQTTVCTHCRRHCR